MSERKASMGDKIYRGDVVKFIRNNISLGTFMKRTVKTADEACWDLCDKLNFVPAINEEQHEQHWIPVTDRLPEKQTKVLVVDFGEVDTAYLNSEGRWMDFHGDKLKDVKAWMPLPKWEGETE